MSPIGKIKNFFKKPAANNQGANPQNMRPGAGGQPRVPAGAGAAPAAGAGNRKIEALNPENKLPFIHENIKKLTRNDNYFYASYITDVENHKGEVLENLNKDFNNFKASVKDKQIKQDKNLNNNIQNIQKEITNAKGSITTLEAKIQKNLNALGILKDAIEQGYQGFDAGKMETFKELLMGEKNAQLPDLQVVIGLLETKSNKLLSSLEDNYLELKNCKNNLLDLQAQKFFLTANQKHFEGTPIKDIKRQFNEFIGELNPLTEDTKALRVDINAKVNANPDLQAHRTALNTIVEGIKNLKNLSDIDIYLDEINTKYLPEITDTDTIPESAKTLKDKLEMVEHLYDLLVNVRKELATILQSIEDNDDNKEIIFNIKHDNKELRAFGQKIWDKLIEAKAVNSDDAASNFANYLQATLADPATIKALLGESAIGYLSTANDYLSDVVVQNHIDDSLGNLKYNIENPADANDIKNIKESLATYMVFKAVEASEAGTPEKITALKANPTPEIEATAIEELKDQMAEFNVDEDYTTHLAEATAFINLLKTKCDEVYDADKNARPGILQNIDLGSAGLTNLALKYFIQRTETDLQALGQRDQLSWEACLPTFKNSISNPLFLRTVIPDDKLITALGDDNPPNPPNAFVVMMMAENEPEDPTQKLLHSYFKLLIDVDPNLNDNDRRTAKINEIHTTLRNSVTGVDNFTQRLEFAAQMQSLLNRLKTDDDAWWQDANTWDNELFNVVLLDPTHPLQGFCRMVQNGINIALNMRARPGDNRDLNVIKKNSLEQLLTTYLTDPKHLTVLTGSDAALKAAYDGNRFFPLVNNDQIAALFNNADEDERQGLLANHIAGIAKKVKCDSIIENLRTLKLEDIETQTAAEKAKIDAQKATINGLQFKDLMALHLKRLSGVEQNDVLRLFLDLRAVIGNTPQTLQAATTAIMQQRNTANQNNDLKAMREAKIKLLLLKEIRANVQADQKENPQVENLPLAGYLAVAEKLMQQDNDVRMNTPGTGLKHDAVINNVLENPNDPNNINAYVEKYPEEVLRFLNQSPNDLLVNYQPLENADIKTPRDLHYSAIATILKTLLAGKNQIKKADEILKLQKQAVEAYLTKIQDKDRYTQALRDDATRLLKMKLENEIQDAEKTLLVGNNENILGFPEAVNKMVDTVLDYLHPYANKEQSSLNDMTAVNGERIEEMFTYKEQLLARDPNSSIKTTLEDFTEVKNELEEEFTDFYASTEDSGTLETFDAGLKKITDTNASIENLNKLIQEETAQIEEYDKLIKNFNTKIDDLQSEHNKAILDAKTNIQNILQVADQAIKNKSIKNIITDINNALNDATKVAVLDKAKKFLKDNIRNADIQNAIDAAIDAAINKAFSVTGATGNANFQLKIDNNYVMILQKYLMNAVMSEKILTKDSLKYKKPSDFNPSDMLSVHAANYTEEDLLKDLRSSKFKNPVEVLNRLAYFKQQFNAAQNSPVNTADNIPEDSFENQIRNQEKSLNNAKSAKEVAEIEKAQLKTLQKTAKANIISKKDKLEQSKNYYKVHSGEVIEKHLSKKHLQDKTLFEKLSDAEKAIQAKIAANPEQAANAKIAAELEKDLEAIQKSLIAESANYIQSTIASNKIELDDNAKISTSDKPLLAIQQKTVRYLNQVVRALELMDTKKLEENRDALNNLIKKEIIPTLQAESKDIKQAIDTLNSIQSKKIAGFDAADVNTLKTHLTSLDKHINALSKTLNIELKKEAHLLQYQVEEITVSTIQHLDAIEKDIEEIEKIDKAKIDKIDANATKILKAKRLNISKILGNLTVLAGLTAAALSAFIVGVIGVSLSFWIGLFAVSGGIFLIGKLLSRYGNRVGNIANDFGDDQSKVEVAKGFINIFQKAENIKFQEAKSKLSQQVMLEEADVEGAFDISLGDKNAIFAENNPAYAVAESIMKKNNAVAYLKSILKHAKHAPLEDALKALQIVNLCFLMANKEKTDDWKQDQQLKEFLNAALAFDLSQDGDITPNQKSQHQFLKNQLRAKLKSI